VTGQGELRLEKGRAKLENAGLFQVTHPSTGVHAGNIHSLCKICSYGITVGNMSAGCDVKKQNLLTFIVTPCINDINHFIIQLMHTT
jgi:hypothetical protein